MSNNLDSDLFGDENAVDDFLDLHNTQSDAGEPADRRQISAQISGSTSMAQTNPTTGFQTLDLQNLYGTSAYFNPVQYVSPYSTHLIPGFDFDDRSVPHLVGASMALPTQDLTTENYFSENYLSDTSLFSQPSDYDWNPLQNIDYSDFMDLVQIDSQLPHEKCIHPMSHPSLPESYQNRFQQSLQDPWQQQLAPPLQSFPQVGEQHIPHYNQAAPHNALHTQNVAAKEKSYTWLDLATGPLPNYLTPEWCVWIIARWMRETSIIANYKHTSSHPKQQHWNKLYFDGFKMPQPGELSRQTEGSAGYKRLIILVKNRIDREVLHAGWILEHKNALKVYGRGKRGWGQRVEWNEETDEWLTVAGWNAMMARQRRPPLPIVTPLTEKQIIDAVQEYDYRNQGVTRKKGQWHLDWPNVPSTPASPKKRKRGEGAEEDEDDDGSSDAPRPATRREKADAKYFKKVHAEEEKQRRIQAAKERDVANDRRGADKTESPLRRSPCRTPRRTPRQNTTGSGDGEEEESLTTRVRQPRKRAKKLHEYTDEEMNEQTALFADSAARQTSQPPQERSGANE